MPGRGRDLECGLGRGFEQQVIDHRLVLIGDVAHLSWQRIHHMEVRHRQQFGLALGQPLACSSALTLGAVPVTAAIVGDDGVSALLVLAARHMAAEGRRAAALDRTHDLHLIEADVPGIGATPRRPMVAEYIRDLQGRTGHGRGLLGRHHWRNGVTHGQLLSWMRSMTPRSSRQGTPPAIDNLYFGYRERRRGACRSGVSRSDLVLWPEPEATLAAGGVRCLGSTCRRSVGPHPTLVTRSGSRLCVAAFGIMWAILVCDRAGTRY